MRFTDKTVIVTGREAAQAQGVALHAALQAPGPAGRDRWLLRNHPEVSEQQVCKLLATTKATVQAVRDRTHWKSPEIRPRDPVILGLCSQTELDETIARARAEQVKNEPPRPRPDTGYDEVGAAEA
jgi:hypothetical protein